MPHSIQTLKIRKNGTLKLSRNYDADIASMTPGMAVQINTATDTIILATGAGSSAIRGLLVEQVTSGEDQNQISLLADQSEVAVEQASLASGVAFTVGGVVYHNAAGKLTPTSGTGNRMGISQSAIYSNSGSDLVMITDPSSDQMKTDHA
jgi:hypothetical protein